MCESTSELPEGQVECPVCSEGFSPEYTKGKYKDKKGRIYCCLECFSEYKENRNNKQAVFNILENRLTKSDCTLLIVLIQQIDDFQEELPVILGALIQGREKV